MSSKGKKPSGKKEAAAPRVRRRSGKDEGLGKGAAGSTRTAKGAEPDRGARERQCWTFSLVKPRDTIMRLNPGAALYGTRDNGHILVQHDTHQVLGLAPTDAASEIVRRLDEVGGKLEGKIVSLGATAESARVQLCVI